MMMDLKITWPAGSRVARNFIAKRRGTSGD